MSEPTIETGAAGLRGIAERLMTVHPAALFVVALAMFLAACVLGYLPEFLGFSPDRTATWRTPGYSEAPFRPALLFFSTLLAFASYTLTTLAYPIAIFATGRLVADAIRRPPPLPPLPPAA